MTRIGAVWCPDWPVVAIGSDIGWPTAIVIADRVFACSASARALGVRRGQRKREAQALAPDLQVFARDPELEARAFEPVAAAIEAVVPGVEILRPGLVVLRAKGAARYFGGEQPLIAALTAAVLDIDVECQVGIADARFAATVAATHGHVVPPGQTAAFLAPLAITMIDEPELTDLLLRLGIRTLGDFAALSVEDVIARFGPIGLAAYRRASGLDAQPSLGRVPPVDMSVETVFDPPIERVDTASFLAKSLADELHQQLDRHSFVCTRLSIEAWTEAGEHLARNWSYDGGFAATAIADRVRWQLDGWLTGSMVSDHGKPTSGVTRLRLVPQQVVPNGLQLPAWGSSTGDEKERADRAVARVQGLLGPDAVVTAVVGAGRDPAEQVRYIPWGEPRTTDPADAHPWPGRLPAPAPATVCTKRLPALLTTNAGTPVVVTARCRLAGEPAALVVEQQRHAVTGWSAPWPLETRWWDTPAARRCARLQVSTDDGGAWLLVTANGEWYVEAIYD